MQQSCLDWRNRRLLGRSPARYCRGDFEHVFIALEIFVGNVYLGPRDRCGMCIDDATIWGVIFALILRLRFLFETL